MDSLHQKYAHLQRLLFDCGSLAVAFSGGVDSGFLLAAAQEALGEKLLAVTAAPVFVPQRELREAAEFCEQRGIRQTVIPAETLDLRPVLHNPPDRCYHCKKLLFSGILQVAAENGMACVAEGSNTDDLGDYRPGMRAIRELGILSPLREAGLSKAEIRALSKELGLPAWNKPSFACLASRFVYGEQITEEKLRCVERSEDFLAALGFRQYRVRIHGNLARIELLPEDFPRLSEPGMRERICTALKGFGFAYVTLDLAGYRTGSMNEVLTQ